MRSKIIIHETAGLCVLLEDTPYILEPDGGPDYVTTPVHDWLGVFEDDRWLWHPYQNGQPVLADGHAIRNPQACWTDDIEGTIGELGLDLPDLTARQLECEHYEFGAGVLLRGCRNVDQTDTLFWVQSNRMSHRLDRETLRRHVVESEGSFWDGDTLESQLRRYPITETPVAATPTNPPAPPAPLVPDALTPEPRRGLPTPDPGPGFRLRRADEVVPVGTETWVHDHWEGSVANEILPGQLTQYHYRLRIPAPQAPTARVVIRQGVGLCVLVEGIRYARVFPFCNELGRDLTQEEFNTVEIRDQQVRAIYNGNTISEEWDYLPAMPDNVVEMPPMPDLNAPVLLAEHWELGVGYLLRGARYPRFIGDGTGPHTGNVSGFHLNQDFTVVPCSPDYAEHWTNEEFGIIWGVLSQEADLESQPRPTWPPTQQMTPPVPNLQRALGNTLHMLYRTQSPLFRGSFRARFNRVVPDLVGDELEAWLLANSVRVTPPTPAPYVPAPAPTGEPELEIVCRFTQERRVVRYEDERGSASTEVTISRSDIEELLEEHEWDLDAVAEALEERAREEVNDDPPDIDDYDHINTDYGDSEYGDTEVTVRTRIRPALEQFIREHNIEQPAEI